MEVFQVREGGETFAVEEKMLVQHFVPGHRDHCGAGNGGGCGIVDSDTGEKGQMVMRWRSDQSFSSQVEVREAEGVSRKPGSAA